MKTKQIDTPFNSCLNLSSGSLSALSQEGLTMGVKISTDILRECLVMLMHFPAQISYLDEDIAEELLEARYFSLEDNEVTIIGRDFLSSTD